MELASMVSAFSLVCVKPLLAPRMSPPAIIKFTSSRMGKFNLLIFTGGITLTFVDRVEE
jgi:hypothetical protein